MAWHRQRQAFRPCRQSAFRPKNPDPAVPRLGLSWDCGKASVEPVGAMLGPVELLLPDGRKVSPLAVAPWGEDTGAEHESLPPLLRRLRGEWPCVPFGAPKRPEGLPERWGGIAVEGAGDDFHGHSSNNRWKKTGSGKGWLELAIDYPEDHCVARLTRRISGTEGLPELKIDLGIEVRRDVSLPIAAHAVFALPETPGAALLRADGYWKGRTYPAEVEPGVSRFVPDKEFRSLDRVPTRYGDVAADLLPLDFDTEEVLHLANADGRVTLENHDDCYRAYIEFKSHVFTGVQLWYSNRGRTAYPWLGRFCAIGIEPVCAAFDLGPEVSCNEDNPIASSSWRKTAARLDADRPFSTTYRIGVEEL